MYRIIAIANLLLSCTVSAFAQDFFQESFELHPDSGGAYSTSVPFANDGAHDYFDRGENGDFGMVPLLNIDGDFFIGAEDTDADGLPGEVQLTLDAVDISGRNDVEISIAMAAPRNNQYDNNNPSSPPNDFFFIETNLDGNGWVLVGAFRGASATNGALKEDTDFDGIGDGIELTKTFRDFTYSLTDTGSALQIRMSISMNSGSEEVAFDNVRVGQSQGVSEPTLQTSNISLVSRSLGSISLSWNIGNGATRILVAGENPIVNVPMDSTSYVANSTFGLGNTIGAGEFVVFKDIGSSVTIDGLNSGTTYHFRAFEYNGNAGSEDYLTSTANGNPYSDSTSVVLDTLPLFQGFESDDSWSYSTFPAPYNESSGTDVWDIVSELGGMLPAGGDYFFGIRDLNNGGSGGSFSHYIELAPVDISAYQFVQVQFNYHTIGFDGADDIEYAIEYDTGTNWNNFISLTKNLTQWTTVSISVPGDEEFVRLRLQSSQDGENDFGGFDNISILETANVPPLVLSASLVNSQTAEITFDRPVNIASAGDTGHYSGLGQIDSVTVDPSARIVQLHLANFLLPEIYSLTIDSVEGENGVSMLISQTFQLEIVPNVIITEIMYNNMGIDRLEFIEIYNNDTVVADLTGWQLLNAVDFIFPDSLKMNPGEYITIAFDAADLNIVFGVVAFEWTSGKLTNTSETIELQSSTGILVDEVTYSDDSPWPEEADGFGPSLELCPSNYNADNNIGGSWQASSTFVTDSYDDGGGPQETVFGTAGNAAQCQFSVEGVLALTNSLIRVTFNASIDSATGLDTSNYSGIGLINNAVIDSLNPRTVMLDISSNPLVLGTFYTFIISGDVTSASGDTMAGQKTVILVFNNTEPSLVITEFLYNDTSVYDSLEFIEIYNNGISAAQLGGIKFTSGIEFAFPTMLLNAGDYLVIARHSEILNNHFGTNVTLEWGDSTFAFVNSLSSFGETIELSNSLDSIIDRLSYFPFTPWPGVQTGTHGGSDRSIVLCDPNLDNSIGFNWSFSQREMGIFAGRMVKGSPGEINCEIANCLSVQALVKVFLEGPFFEGTQLMDDEIRQAGDLPFTEPFTAMGFTVDSAAQGRAMDSALVGIDDENAIVDWVLAELREAGNNTSVVTAQPCLLQRDGDVIEFNGNSTLTFDCFPFGTYHVAIRHANHLGIMTSIPIVFGPEAHSIDFTNPLSLTNGAQAQKLNNGTNMMWAGNVIRDGELKYAGSNNDRDPILTRIGGTVPTNTVNGYFAEDVNRDGEVKYAGSDNDRDIILLNIGGAVPTNTRDEQLP